MNKRPLFSIIFALFLSANINAQKDSATSEICTPQFARSTVEQQVAESKMIEETDKRIKILMRSADFLWKYDEPTARKFFKEAFETADARFKEKGFESRKITASKSGGGVVSENLPDYRTEVIAAIAKKDSVWAKRLSEQVLADFEKDFEANKDKFEDRGIVEMLRIANESVETNSALSQYIYRRVMRFPLDSYWFYTLLTVAEKNKNFADSLYLELLQNYQNETPRRFLYLSAYPFARDRVFGANANRMIAFVPAGLNPNPNLQAKFLETLFARMARFATNPEDLNRPPDEYELPHAVFLLTALQDVEPLVTQNFPALIPKFSTAKAQATSLISEEMNRKLEGNKKSYSSFDSGIEERFEKLKKDDLEGKLNDSQIVFLVTRLKKERDFAEAESWLQKIKDDEARRSAENYFYFMRSKSAVKDKRFDDAKKYALSVEEIEHRAILYFDIAGERLKIINEMSSVSDVLSEVSAISRKADDTVEKAQVLLGLALAYEKFDHLSALNELNEAVKIINRLENPNIFADHIGRQIRGKDFVHYIMFNTPGYNLEKAFTDISKNDFETTLSTAQNLSDRYFRTLAVIAVVKNCVEKAEKKSVKGKKKM